MTITINGDTGIAGVDGTASVPAVQGTDTNTGVFYPAADTVGISTGGSERMRVDSSGNVGIGTSSPSYRLDAISSGGTQTARFRSGDTATSVDIASFERSDSAVRAVINYNSSDGTMTYGTSTNHPIGFKTNNSERMRIDSSGNLLVGTTSWIWTSNEKMSLLCGSRDGLAISTSAANLLLMKTAFSNNYYVAFGNSSATTLGSITGNGSTVAYNTSSDYRLKENVQPMHNALETVSQLNPVKYTWKADGSDGEGFLAHELQAIIPQAVNGEKDAVDVDGKIVPQGVDYSKIVVHLVAAVQELSAKVDAQAAEIAALKATR